MRYRLRHILLATSFGMLSLLCPDSARAQEDIDSNVLPEGSNPSSVYDVRSNGAGKSGAGPLSGSVECPPGTPPERCISPGAGSLDNGIKDNVLFFNSQSGIKGQTEAERPRQTALGALVSPYVLAAATVNMVEPALGAAWMDSIAHAIASWNTTVNAHTNLVDQTKGKNIQQYLLGRAYQACLVDAMASGPPAPDALENCARSYNFSYLPEHPSRAVDGVAARAGIRSAGCPADSDTDEICFTDLLLNTAIEKYSASAGDPSADQALGNLKAIDTFMSEHVGDIKFVMDGGSAASSTTTAADIDNNRVVKREVLPPMQGGKPISPNDDILLDAKKRYTEIVRVMEKYCKYVTQARDDLGTGGVGSVDEYGVPNMTGALLDFDPFKHTDFWTNTNPAASGFSADDMRALSLPDFRFTPALGDALYNYFLIGGGAVPTSSEGSGRGLKLKCELLDKTTATNEAELFSSTDEARKKDRIEKLDQRRQRYWAYANALAEGRYLMQMIIIKRGVEQLAQSEELLRSEISHLGPFRYDLQSLYTTALENLRAQADRMYRERAQSAGGRANFLGKGGTSKNDGGGLAAVGGGQ